METRKVWCCDGICVGCTGYGSCTEGNVGARRHFDCLETIKSIGAVRDRINNDAYPFPRTYPPKVG